MISFIEIILDRCVQLEGDRENFIDASNLKVKKLNRTTRGIVGNLTFHVPLDNSYLAEATVYKKQGGEYRLMPFRYPPTGLCTAVNTDKVWYPDFVKVSDLPYPMPCPSPIVSQLK